MSLEGIFSAYLYPPIATGVIRTVYYRGAMFIEFIDAEQRTQIRAYNITEDDYDYFVRQKNLAKFFQEHIRHSQQTCDPQKYPRGWKKIKDYYQ